MMSATTIDILSIFFAVAAFLTFLTIIGELLRTRFPAEGENSGIETFMMRVHSWWAMVICLGLALLSGRVGVLLLFGFASFAALREFLSLTYKRQADHLALATAFFIVLPLQYVFVGLGLTGLFTVFIPVYASLLLPAISALRADSNQYLVRVAETQWGLMIAVYCASHVPALMLLNFPGAGADRTILLVAFLVMVVQIGDLADFFIGRAFGERKIVSGLSPKTWEGTLSGIAFAGLAGAALSWLSPFTVLGAIVMAMIASTFGMLGNLVFSAIKRDRGVQDFSHLLQGQGGILNQMDSVLFAAPVFYHLCLVYWAG